MCKQFLFVWYDVIGTIILKRDIILQISKEVFEIIPKVYYKWLISTSFIPDIKKEMGLFGVKYFYHPFLFCCKKSNNTDTFLKR